jgi:NAD(P)-dependent dehydrogenase (short-subunit alcohol dehydrogenase family)
MVSDICLISGAAACCQAVSASRSAWLKPARSRFQARPIGLNGAAAYGAAKAALSSMTRAWAAEFSPKGVRVNAVGAGPIYTRPEARERFDALGATTLLNRAADTDEIAEVVCFLASPRASYVTGAIVAADGGRTAI